MLATLAALLTTVTNLTAEKIALLQRLMTIEAACDSHQAAVQAARTALDELARQTAIRIQNLEHDNRLLREHIERLEAAERARPHR